MAVTAATAPVFSEYHFTPSELDALIAAHGAPAELRQATRHACWDAATGQPDPACMVCFPFGVVWDAPVALKVYGPTRRGLRHYELMGSLDSGDCLFTFPTGIRPPHLSRLVLTASELTVDDVLTRGQEDIVRYSRPVAVETAHYAPRVPDHGAPYERPTVPLAVGTDLALTDRVVTWLTDTVPEGARYVLRLRTCVEYLLYDAQDRNERGVVLNYRYFARRLDYLLHPRGEEQGATY